jgi:ATP-dependent Clp protease ATP-binding subunit ClpA
VTLTDAARTFLAEKGYDPKMGARPLSRVIDTEVKTALSEELLFGKLAEGGEARIDVQEGKLDIQFASRSKEAPTPDPVTTP